ncbi:uncharacterized protein LOC142326076 isoform X1 [Lycorma delicatula]|uniref:uncharacterized protein LOC142326076 isoform X1 n=1 Tax=Lycorma delicatula TaxID=130591 RepID=UPI003F5194E3
MYRNNKLCRLCLVEVDSLVPIFTTKNVSETSSLQMKIMELANVQVYAGDGLPSSVCLNCSKLLDSYHAFKVQIEKADVILRHQLSTNQVDPLSIETKVEGETTDADVLKAETVLIKEEEIPEDQVENILQPSLSPSATHSPLPSPSASPVPASPVNNDEDDETPDGHDNEVDPLSADITDPPDPPTDSTTVVEQDTMSPPVSVPIPVVSSVGNQVISSVPIISSGINQNTTLAPVSVISTGVNQVASISQLPVISSVTGGVNRTTNLASVPVISSGTNQATNLAPLPIISSVSGSVNQATSLASVPVISGGGVNQPTGLLLVATPLIVSSNSKNQDLNKKSVTTVVGNTNTFVAVPTLSSVTAPTTFVTVPSSTVTSATFNLDKTSIESKDPLDVSNNDPGPSTSNAGINKVGESSSSNEAQPKVKNELLNSSGESEGNNNRSRINEGIILRNILTQTNGGKKWKCDVCNESFLTSKRLGRHKTNVHVKNEVSHRFHSTQEYIIDSSTFGDENVVLRVVNKVKKSNSVKEWKCEVCGTSVNSYILFRKHRATHVNRTCKICDKTFTKLYLLKCHISKVHSLDQDYHGCKICGKLLKNELMLKKHMFNLHSEQDKKIFSCNICNKRFSSKSYLKRHKETIHTQINTVLCKVCGKVFKSEVSVKSHMKYFHMKSYNLCYICGKVVRCVDSHVRLVHTESTNECLKCDVCGKSYKNDRLLKVHKNNVHYKTERNHVCEICGASFKTSNVLSNHLIVHSDERNFKCEICNRTFKCETVLKTHKRVHSDYRPYYCNICGESFKWKNSYDKHFSTCSENVTEVHK